MSTVTIDAPSQAAVTIDFDTPLQIELNGGESSITVEQPGTIVQVFNQSPDITDLLAQYRLLSN